LIKYLVDGKEIPNGINFGIVEKTKIGRITVELVNEYLDKVELMDEYTVDPDVYIVEYTKKIAFKGTGHAILEFRPTKTRLESLKNKKFGFKVLIG